MQSQVRFNRVPEKVPASLGAKSSQVQQGYGEGSEGSGEGLGGFGAEPGQVQQGSGEGSEGSGEGSGKPWCKARSGSTGFRRRLQEALVQSQVRLNRVPEKVPEGSRNLGAKPSQVQQGSGEGSGEGSRKPWCKVKSGSTGLRRRFRRFRRRSGRLWCRARSGSTGFRRRFRRRFQEALVQSQVRSNRVVHKQFGRELNPSRRTPSATSTASASSA